MSVFDAFKKIKSSIAATAIVALHQARLTPDYEDADDYVQTMTIIESLIARGGLDHRDIVMRLRQGRPTMIDGKPVQQGGNKNRLSQVAKLRASSDPLYMARGGVTDGSAMHILGPAFFFRSEREMIFNVNFISRITHASEEASLAAILVALRMRQAFHTDAPGDLNYAKLQLLELFRVAASKCGLANGKAYEFMSDLLTSTINEKTQERIIEAVGLLHVATSTPVAAVACSFLPTTSASHIATLDSFLSSQMRSLDETVELHREHFRESPTEVASDWGYALSSKSDVDTFASILLQIKALADPIDSTVIEKTREAFFEDWDEKAWILAERGWR